MAETPAALRLTTSWDDGHPADLRLAEALARHGVAATFYVPAANREGRPVMTPVELRGLAAAGFELAAHTRDHCRLARLPLDEARRQIVDGRHWLEDLLGGPVRGFAYPGGAVGRHGRRLARDAGFAYARTTRMFCLAPGRDPFDLPTTAQFYAHGPAALLRNWARRGAGLNRLRLAARCIAAGGVEAAVGVLLDEAAAQGGVFHLWGHSWELDREGLWPSLDRVLAVLAARIPRERRIVNAGLVA